MLHVMGEMGWQNPPPEEVLLAFYESTAAAARIAWNPYFHNPALERRLDRISAPTLVLWGAEDRLIPRRHGERYRDRIKDAQLRTIAHCGHLPVLEKPQELVEEVTKFVEGLRTED
jgi:pimeloyl-ACP methyl ester carboxylesterase